MKVRYVGVHPKYLIVKRVMTDPVEWEKKSDGTDRITKGGKKIHKAKVPAKWVWGDQLIKARPEDTKAHNLVVLRSIVYPKAPIVIPPRVPVRVAARKKPKPISPKKRKKLFVNQDVETKVEGRKVYAQITALKRNGVELDYFWPPDNEYYNTTVDRQTVKALPDYDLEDKVFVKDEGKWHRGEIDNYRRKDNTYRVFWRENNKRWSVWKRQRDMKLIK